MTAKERTPAGSPPGRGSLKIDKLTAQPTSNRSRTQGFHAVGREPCACGRIREDALTALAYSLERERLGDDAPMHGAFLAGHTDALDLALRLIGRRLGGRGHA